MESKEPKVTTSPLMPLMYSNRVTLKTILEGSVGEMGLVGKTVVIGGWVKSSKELKKEPVPSTPAAADALLASPGPKDVRCV